MQLLKQTQNTLAALLLVVALFVTGFHEASNSHSDQHAREHCGICLAVQTIHNSDLGSAVSVPLPVATEEAHPNVAQTYNSDFISTVFQSGAPPTGPPSFID